MRELLYSQWVGIWVNVILNHIDTRVILSRFLWSFLQDIETWMRSKTKNKTFKYAYPVGVKLKLSSPHIDTQNDIKRKTIPIQQWFVLESKMKEIPTLNKIEGKLLDPKSLRYNVIEWGFLSFTFNVNSMKFKFKKVLKVKQYAWPCMSH